MKNFWNYVISFLCIIGGIYFILKPNYTFSSLVYYLGLIILVIGIIKILYSLLNKENNFSLGNSFWSGIINIIFGIILMVNKQGIQSMISSILGIWLIISSTSNLVLFFNKTNRTSVDVRYLVKTILKLILGIIVITTPIITFIFVGWVLGVILVAIGIGNLINIYQKRNVYKVKIK